MTVSVRDGNQTYTFNENTIGVIDATDFFNTERFMLGSHTLSRSEHPVEALSLHHWVGWRLPATATVQEEFDRLIQVADFHYDKYNIGPAYWTCGYASGRVWAVGKFGSHRASVAGRSPASRALWNYRLVAHAQAGNFEVDAVTEGDARALIIAFTEMYSWPTVTPETPIYEHGLTPTVNSRGVVYSQSTACPGRNIAAFRAAGKLIIPGIGDSHEPDRYNQGYVDALKLLSEILQPDGTIGHAVMKTLHDIEEEIEKRV